MVVGFDEDFSDGFSGPGHAPFPRVLVDRTAFETTEQVDMYNNDVHWALTHHLAEYKLPGLGAALALRQLADELLPLCRELHYRAYDAVDRTPSKRAVRRDSRTLSNALQGLLPRITELRAVATEVLDGIDREYGLDGLSMHPGCPDKQKSTLLGAAKSHISRTLAEAKRVARTGTELATMLAADATQRSAILTNRILSALTVALTLIGVMSLGVQAGLLWKAALIVGLCILLCGVLLYLAVRLASTSRRRGKDE